MNTVGLQVSHFWCSRYLLNGSGGKQASFVIVTMARGDLQPDLSAGTHFSSQDTRVGLPVGDKLGTLALKGWALAK